MLKKDAKIALNLKRRISAITRIVDFRMFGSRARGTADIYSDMDIFIEVKTLDKKTKEKILNIVWETSLEYGLLISPLIFTKNEIENTAMRSSSIIKNIEMEGIKL